MQRKKCYFAVDTIHSCRRASIGSILAARRAGSQQLRAAVNVTKPISIHRLLEFPDWNPGSIARRVRIEASVIASPEINPMIAVTNP